jgi:hypothetical protein
MTIEMVFGSILGDRYWRGENGWNDAGAEGFDSRISGKVGTHCAIASADRSYVGTEVWKQVQAQPQMQQWVGLLSRFWNNPTQFDEVYGWMIDWMPAIDFSVNVLKEDFGIEHWSANVKLRQECFWVYPFEQVCLVIDRPMRYSFDADRQLHGTPAIVFRDGTSLSAEHGKVLF